MKFIQQKNSASKIGFRLPNEQAVIMNLLQTIKESRPLASKKIANFKKRVSSSLIKTKDGFFIKQTRGFLCCLISQILPSIFWRIGELVVGEFVS